MENVTTQSGSDIQAFLRDKFSDVEFVFQGPPIPTLEPKDVSVPLAVVRCVSGQMLSRKAAATINQRLEEKAGALNVLGPWELQRDELIACGLSRRKARTIEEFSQAYASDPEVIENWRNLKSEELFPAVEQFWGLSTWTAAILAIFYFAQPDVYPHSDGSIKRAVSMLDQIVGESSSLNSDSAAPFRSYLALYLWRALDSGVIEQYV